MPSQSHRPVVINVDTSSPDNDFRLPSATPRSVKKATNEAVSSSPGLLSPSAFFAKPNASALVAGSRAEKVPEGATTGFTSAACLLKSTHFGGAKEAARTVSREREKSTASRERDKSVTPFEDWAYLEPSPVAARASRSPHLVSPIVLKPPSDVQQPESRIPSLTFVENGFRPGQERPDQAVEAVPKPVKRARKLKTVVESAITEKPAKQPRKKPAKVVGEKKSEKSASFILNSDDLASTQFAGLEAKDVQGDRPVDSTTKPVPAVQTSKGKSKTKKAAAEKTIDEQDDATSKPRKKPAKARKSITKVTEVEQDQQSAFFAKEYNPPEVDLEAFALPGNSKVHTDEVDSMADATPAQAHRRRLSWTPAKNTSHTTLIGPDTSCSIVTSDDKGPTINLADMIGNFEYASHDKLQPVQRELNGEAHTKRRRVDLADGATRAPALRKAETAPPPIAPEPKKKEKAPKKRPQTITDLATKAYRPEELPPAPATQPTVSSFFVSEAPAPVPEVTAVDAPEPPKVKKPRKSRATKTDANSATGTAKERKAKTKKVKFRFDEADHLAKLYQPEEARKEERKQDFLFGTSSQLGGGDSPTFIRQMQFAVKESESFVAHQNGTSPISKSYPRAATDKCGRGVAVAQGDRQHWCCAARDQHGKTFNAREVGPELVVGVEQIANKESSLSRSKPVEEETSSVAVERQETAVPLAMIDDQPTACLSPKRNEAAREIVDLCQSSSPVAQVTHAPAKEKPKDAKDSTQRPRPADKTSLPGPGSVPAEPEPLAQFRDVDHLQIAAPPISLPAGLPMFKPKLATLRRTATSPIRPALQTLDSNAHSFSQTSPFKDADAFQHRATLTSTSTSAIGRPRGRPKKKDREDETVTTPKRRGRPPKQKQAIPDDLSPSKISTAFKSPSQPLPSPQFVNIDEISDDPDAPTTPSPPRRRATSSPSPLQPLELAITAEAPTIISTTKLKCDDPAWSSIATTLFPKISAAIRSTPPTSDLQNPSWYEKILLYDPIVLEDLTAWLNEKGVRLEIRKLKSIPSRTKSRKRKVQTDAGGAEDVLGPSGVVTQQEYETHESELLPWMVQKWCEYRSVCCLWREGLRGGVRVRY